MKSLIIHFVIFFIGISVAVGQMPFRKLENQSLEEVIGMYMAEHGVEGKMVLMIRFYNPVDSENENYEIEKTIKHYVLGDSIDTRTWLYSVNIWQRSISLSEKEPLFISEQNGVTLLIYSSLSEIFKGDIDEKDIVKFQKKLGDGIGSLLDRPTWIISRTDDFKVKILECNKLLY